MQKYEFSLDFYTATKSIDLGSRDDYVKPFIEWIDRLVFNGTVSFQKSFVLQVNEIELHDDRINPFDQLSETINLINVVKLVEYPITDPQEHFNSALGGLEIIFELDANVKKFSRKRYSFWEALSDIGGFFDGLKLLIGLFMAPLSGAFFSDDLVKGAKFYKKTKKLHRSLREQAAIAITNRE